LFSVGIVRGFAYHQQIPEKGIEIEVGKHKRGLFEASPLTNPFPAREGLGTNKKSDNT
jgi:hypothetical protein